MTVAEGESTRTRHGLIAAATRCTRRPCLLVFVAALLVRGGLGLALGVQRGWDERSLLLPDEQQYWQIARSLHAGGRGDDELGFVATRMPLFVNLLSVFAGFDVGPALFRTLLWLIGALAAVCAAGLAGATLGSRAALPAGLLVAFDPYLVYFSSLILTETIAITALVAFWWRLALMLPGAADAADACVMHRHAPGRPCSRRWWMIAALAALCVHARESNLVFVAAALGYVLITHRFRWFAVKGGLIVALTVAATLVPWAMRNASETGRWCWLTHRGGITLYDGVHEGATGASDLGAIKAMPAVQPYIVAGDEAGWDRYFRNRAWEAMRADPARIARLAGVKLARTWNVFPNADAGQGRVLRWVSAGWTLPVYALAAAGAFLLLKGRVGSIGRGEGGCAAPGTSARDSGRNATGIAGAGYLLLPALVVCLLHSVFVGSVRYRLPAMPMLEVLAAAGIVAMMNRRGSTAGGRISTG